MPEAFDATPEALCAYPRDLLAQARLQATDERLLDCLERLACDTPQTFTRRLGLTLHYPVLDSHSLLASTPRFDKLALAQCLKRECVLIEQGGQLLGVFADPFDHARLAWIDDVLQGAPLYLAHAADLATFLARHEESFHAVDALDHDADASSESDPLQRLSLASISEDQSRVVKLVNSTLYDALKLHASDIHLGMTGQGLTIKYRIDGVLNGAGKASGSAFADQVISRIKVMAELDIGEKRVPQDGRFKVAVGDRQIDFRVSIMPSIFGEDAVLRVLDKQDLSDRVSGVQLQALGFADETLRALRRLAAEPYGMILVTGPTGSGKTTTLYAMISEINHGVDKIITIEDPVEYQLPGVLQIPVNEKKGLTFARGLRSILRHDPDKILVGEIRDPDTAQIAVQSALTGHLVFTTIHANNVFDVIGRFSQMQVDPYSFVSALNAVLAQRLIRLACPHCATPCEHDDDTLYGSGLTREGVAGWTFVRVKGCGHCRGSGYRGRSAIAELLHLDDDLRQMIVERRPLAQIKTLACQRGLRLLRASALDLVRDGRTTLEEINRVTFI
ncbi:GspE/PulE family protein [Pseudomonas sp. GD03817]|uniref:Type II secretion system protein E n=2 Tax=Pseudomonas TaxID=286 RepID=A0AAD2W553_PSEPU|nr:MULTISPECIES: GspE/PulE family protein [Pseudomonas]EKT4503123.1 type II/IV secretion system protein [Pseudomonas putida]ELS0926378.1 type II/IV secretion system protein [Pseudomonas putida]ENY74244.1 type II secretion system protein E [Pseudomonas putida TRO1]MCE0987940.1 GspE/PulE family protein [Pseudomonas alloputida]MDD2037684.1 GspE/PulE family protein [Pseudomonas putida]